MKQGTSCSEGGSKKRINETLICSVAHVHRGIGLTMIYILVRLFAYTPFLQDEFIEQSPRINGLTKLIKY